MLNVVKELFLETRVELGKIATQAIVT